MLEMRNEFLIFFSTILKLPLILVYIMQITFVLQNFLICNA